ncbi:AAA family ATPase [Rhizobium sp. AG855]|uniref:AAA family ATPase n=1 Tax=Rhizobium sp. AG855 TaxID=2183898 RepID=UPI000E76A939|nr:AAA family ATPase [Rhizobium sp. AG855]RKE83279.1 AAA domain-containing protein [Rhizobium sp. AG855]
MKISALRLFNVKRFAGRGVAIEGIGDGVNVLCAANEFGKSTSFEALHALFFQPHSGTPGDVQRLRPYSGGNPLVEADITTGEGSFRITKQYYGGRSARVVDLGSGRLVAQADEAENFITSLIRGGTSGPARLEVAGIGTISLRSNRPGRRDNQLVQAEAARTALLASMGVDSLSAARDRQARAQQANADLRGLKDRLSFIAPEGLAKLREEVEVGSTISLEGLDLDEDPALLRNALAQAEERRKQARLALREVEPDQSRADDAFVAAETRLASLISDQTQLAVVLGPEEARAERERSLSATLADLDQSLSEAEAHVLKLGTDAGDLASIEAALTRARSIEAAVEKEINALRETMAGLNAEIRAQSEEAVEEKWRETSEALDAATARVAAYEKEVAVLQRVTTALDDARSEARELYLKPVMAELRPLLRLLFDDVAITFDDKTLLPQTILRNGQEEDVDRLSGGMREQLSVLTRLAFARLLARDGRPAPVILDDALVYSDDDRIEKMFDALHRQSRDQQIIVFSCRQRAFQKLGGNVLQMIDWQP